MAISSAPFNLSSLTIRPVAPDDTPITSLALTQDGINLLTPAALRLTKIDLVNLAKDPQTTQAALNLTVADITSIQQAYSQHLQVSAYVSQTAGMAGEPLTVTIATTTTPCCCAAAVPVEVAIQ